MSKIRLAFILLLFFCFYKVFQMVNNFKGSASNKIIELQDKAGIERKDNVVVLLLFKSGKVKLIDYYPLNTALECINQRNYLRNNISLKYQCAYIEANIISGKVTKILNVKKILK